jgi:Arc/MetJ family transcription regulator
LKSRKEAETFSLTSLQFAGIRSSAMDTPIPLKLVYNDIMARTNININETLIRKARKLTRLKTKREIVDTALELLVRSEDRKSILRYHGSGIWKGNYKLARRNRV